MGLLLSAGSYTQFITVLIIFVVVLGITAWVTGWLANYQRAQNANCNIEVVETVRIAANKYIQLLRVGETYKVIAVCRDTVTLLGEVPAGQLRLSDAGKGGTGFKELLMKSIRKDSGDQSE